MKKIYAMTMMAATAVGVMSATGVESSKVSILQKASQEKPVKKVTAKPSLVDAPGFQKMTREVLEYRKKRLVNLEQFNKMAKEPGTIILDSRSKWAYEAFHVKGAIHMSFSDFTQEKLDKLIPDKTTRILIYCNNNFESEKPRPAIAAKSSPLALNIPTFINLYGYGFKNIYELGETVKVEDNRLEVVEKKK